MPVRRAALLLCAAACLPLAAQAQGKADWPTRPIRLIVGYASGSSPDVQARLLAEPLTKALGQPVVVENKGGASGNIGADAVAKAGDGHTIGVIGNGPLTSSKFLYSKLPYDPIKDLAPLAMIGSAPLVLVAPKSMAANAGAYFKALKTGAQGNYGSVGTGSGGHLGVELIKEAMGLNLQHVPYNGGPAVVNALMGDQVQMALLPASTVMPLVQSGKLAALAVSSSKRSPLAPGVPAMPEIGAGNVDIEVWNAVMAPASMPAEHRAKLAAALEKILHAPDIRSKLLAQGWRIDDTSAVSLARRIENDARIYGSLITQKNIRLE
ncbi:Bug family tripartite tricarboxylate transporter substrate binding protein [Comamonas testosteroni]|uniref:Bug family tripartite tricarboxylate transporter substrate binding protein n=1 Tax=Comamonas testosteroni TaxID=285 RepID=UPI0026E98A57|nr:tripartite tricarboxylate transporter substrate binding protein [Comamonas testosteroni]WQD45826.1 tripartite tricarboxylate transporter substrate binding protein [Comamonas testosteroni]